MMSKLGSQLSTYNTRHKFTGLLWVGMFCAIVLFISIIEDTSLALAVSAMALIFFGKFMFMRTYWLDHPKSHWKCRLRMHDLEGQYLTKMEGTGKFIGGEEIMKQARFTRVECKRKNCDYWDVEHF